MFHGIPNALEHVSKHYLTTSVLEAAFESNNSSIALALVLFAVLISEILSDVNSLSLDKSEGRGAAVVVAACVAGRVLRVR